MILALGTDLAFRRRSLPAQAAEPAMFALAELPRDKLIYDSGHAATTLVPVSGSAPKTQKVEARIIAESGEEIVPWTEVSDGSSESWTHSLPCPLKWAWMRIQARLRSSPETVTETSRRFGVGHVVSIWGESNAIQYWNSQSALPAEAPVEILDHVQALKTNRATNGCQWNDRFKLPGVDPLPEGVLLDGLELSITQDQHFEGWDFTGFLLAVRAKLTLSNCILGERDGPTGLVAAVDVYPEGDYDLIEYCDFIGPSQEGGYGLFLKIRTGGNSRVEQPVFRRNRLWGFGSDGIKPNKGLVEWNYFDAPINLNVEPHIYDETATYLEGELVRSAQRHIWRALSDTTGVAPPSSKSGASSIWQNLDPHADLITVPESSGGVVIRANFLNRDAQNRAHPMPGRGVTGINNAIRLVRNNSGATASLPFDKVEIEYCVIPGDPESYSFPIQTSSGSNPAFFADPEIRHCRIMPRRNNGFLHPTSRIATPIWKDVVDLEGVEAPLPSNCVEGDSLRVQMAEAVQHIWHDRETSGLAGATYADGTHDLDPALAALSNALASSRPGEKFCIIHHTSVQGSMADMVTDASVGRSWNDELALHGFAVGNGQNPRLAVTEWPFQPSAVTQGHGDLISTFFSGQKPDGSDLSLPADIVDSETGAVHRLEHVAQEVYGSSLPVWKAADTSSPSLSQDMLNSRQFVSGEDDPTATLVETARIFARSRVQITPLQGIFLPDTAEFIGFSAQGGDPTNANDGKLRHARIMAAMIASQIATQRGLPEFDRSNWEASGQFVDVWWSKAAITTTRLSRLKPGLAASYSHWTDVFGFEINGLPASNAQIVNGRVRIYPNSGSFGPTDVLTFGGGRGHGQLKYPEDEQAGTWENLPIANLGVYGLEGVAVRPMPDPAVLQNTLGL